MTDEQESTVVPDHTDQGGDTRQLVVFRLGTEEYGVDIDQIKEVVLTPRITKMPQMPSYVAGVANVRGKVLAIVKLEDKLEIEAPPAAAEKAPGQYTLVADDDTFGFGVLVKEVPNTISVRVDAIQEPTNIVPSGNDQCHYIKGIVRKDDRLIILIDLRQIVEQTTALVP